MIETSSELLEYERLRALLARYVLSPGGRVELERMEPVADRAWLAEAAADLAEALAWERTASQPQPAQRGAAIRLRFDALPDVAPHLAKLHVPGVVLEGLAIRDLAALLDRAGDVRSVLTAAAERFPRLAGRAHRIAEFQPLLRELAGKIEPDGTLNDHASVALNRIRRDLDRQQRLIQESLERFLKAHRDDGILQEEFVTFRNERFVLPIVTGKKKRVAGIIHAASGTGHTLFIEPLETVELNNDLVRLREEEQREIHRILTDMTERLRVVEADVAEALTAMGELEWLFAKARFAVDFNAVIARFSEPGSPRLALDRARHPLLEDVLGRQRSKVVPLTVELGADTRTLVISGPNTGGKTVALKTVGLLALMAQSGLPVPAEAALFPVFTRVLADIGDNQSIEQSLSTFSAHILRIRAMLASLGPDSLVLLDELGRATDPEEGGALGVAIVDHVRQAGAFTLVSTHLVAPKIYAATNPGVLNGSMSFDEQTLAPTFVLRVGVPGASAGLRIARRLGLDPALVESAERRLDSAQREVNRFLSLLEERLETVARLERDCEARRAALDQERARLAAQWEKKEAARIRELERRSEELFAQFDTRARETLERLEAAAAEKRSAMQAHRRVAQTKRQMREDLEAALRPKASESAPPQPALREGVRVRLRGVREPARVRRLMGGDVLEVEAGFLRLQVSREDVLEVLAETPPAARLPRGVSLHTQPRAGGLAHELNVIGKRAEEARDEVDKFLDNAALAGLSRLRIVHGHGMGILKRTIAELLRGHPLVEKFHDAEPAEGGAGATIVEMRLSD